MVWVLTEVHEVMVWVLTEVHEVMVWVLPLGRLWRVVLRIFSPSRDGLLQGKLLA